MPSLQVSRPASNPLLHNNLNGTRPCPVHRDEQLVSGQQIRWPASDASLNISQTISAIYGFISSKYWDRTSAAVLGKVLGPHFPSKVVSGRPVRVRQGDGDRGCRRRRAQGAATMRSCRSVASPTLLLRWTVASQGLLPISESEGGAHVGDQCGGATGAARHPVARPSARRAV